MQFIVNGATKFGHQFTRGCIYAVCELVFILAMISLAFNAFGRGTDDSDFSGWKRSGLAVHTDAKTGLQYLRDGKGALIPRVGRDGRQLLIDGEE